MDIKQFNNALCHYNRSLTQINESDFSYTLSIKNATDVFFKEINKIDSQLISYFLENLDKETIPNNKKQAEAFKFFLILAIQSYKEPVDFIEAMFPEYIENKHLKSDWWIIRILQFFIFLLFKPKLTLLNLPDTEKIKNAVERIQRPHKNKEFYDALEIIMDKFLKKELLVKDYLPLNQNEMDDQWEHYKKKPCYTFKDFKMDGHYHLDTDILLDYLSKRISFFTDSKEKRFLSFSLAALRDYAYKVDIFSFKNKVEEIKNYLKGNSYHHQGRVNGILNLIEKIMQRMHILNKDLFSINFYCSDEYLTEKIDYLKFCYEHHRARWEKSYHDGENTANYYELLNSFENILYDAIFILDRDKLAENLRFNDIAIILQDKENISERSTSGVERLKSKKMLIKNLDLKLTELRNHTAQLRNFTKTVVLNRLADDMYQLIEHIEEVAQNLSEEMHEMEFLSSDFEDEQSEAFESSRVSTKEIQRSNASISSMYRFFSTVDEDNRPEKQNRSPLLQQATVS